MFGTPGSAELGRVFKVLAQERCFETKQVASEPRENQSAPCPSEAGF